MIINPIYTPFAQNINTNWESFKSSAEELRNGPKVADFSIDTRTWSDTCKKIAVLLLTIILFPCFLLQRILMQDLYPAQSAIVKCCRRPALRTGNLDRLRTELPAHFPRDNQIIRHVRLDKDGTSYSGLLIAKVETIRNGKWILQAVGNRDTIERAALSMNQYQVIGYNILMMNGPGVGRSEGLATTGNLGGPQEIGLSYLEHALQAKEIVPAGFSLGGLAIAKAVEEHRFLPDRKYLIIRQMGFDSVGNVGCKTMERRKSCLAPFAKYLARLGNIEADSLIASRKLIQLKIPEAVIHAGDSPASIGDDGVIHPQATHGGRLLQEGITEHKYFYHVPSARHELPLTQTIQAIQEWENSI